MRGIKQLILTGLTLGVLVLITPAARAEEPSAESDCKAIITLLNEQNSKLSGETRRIQREIAALRADLDKPGFKDVVAGIGYILGLFGVAAFVAARRKG